MEFNSDFKYDLAIGKLGEGILSELISDSKIEVKTDLQYHKTGNFYIEYESRGKPSGISTSEADYWALIGTNSSELKKENVCFFIIIELDRLKKLCKSRYFRKRVKGGDSDTSIGLLIKGTDLL